MVDGAVTWLMAHPLSFVGGLAVFAVAFGSLLIPRVHEMVGHGHPRC